MTSMTMKGGTRPRPATFSAMAAAPLPPASPLPLASPWVLPWTPLLHHDADAVAALVGGDLATRGFDAQPGRAAHGVDPLAAALRAQVVAVLAPRALPLGGALCRDVGYVRRSHVHPTSPRPRCTTIPHT